MAPTKATSKRTDHRREIIAGALAELRASKRGKAEDPILDHIEALLEWRAYRENGDARTRGEVTTKVTRTWRPVEAMLKIDRSDAIYDLKSEGVVQREIGEIMGGINRARVDQILKGVSGGKYHQQQRRETAE